MDQILHYFREGGLLMWPLLVCSLLAVAVIIERFVRLRRSNLIDPGIVEEVQVYLERGRYREVIDAHRRSPVLIGRILSKGVEQHFNTGSPIETSLTEAGNRGLQVLFNNLGVLNLVAKVAPLLGLLGTVLGMILGFEVLEQAGVRKENLAHAIRVALITTATGLSIAIPAVVAGAYFRSRIRAYQAEIEDILLDVINTVKSTKTKRDVGAEVPTEMVPGRKDS